MTGQATVKTGLTWGEQRLGWLAVLGLGALLTLFQLVEIGSAVIAQGQVVVRGKPRPVQSLEGGQVREILVREGETVQAGQVVLELDPSLTLISRDILRSRLAELVARVARLEAEQRQLPDLAPVEAADGLDAGQLARHLAGQKEMFFTRRAVLENRRAQLEERKVQHRAQIAGLEAQIVSSEEQLALITRELSNLETLLSKGLLPESRVLELQRRQAGILGQVAQQRAEIVSLRTAIRDAGLEIAQSEQEFVEGAVAELREAAAAMQETRLELARSEILLQQLKVRAPVSGVVHELQIWTSGGAVPPMETLMTVVPVSEGVELEIRVMPDAIDTVYLGQEARIRLPSFDQHTTPELVGSIAAVAPDSVTDPVTGQAFYRVNLALPEEELVLLGDADLIPGMPVEAFLHTGNRTILSFLLQPVLDQLAYAFRES